MITTKTMQNENQSMASIRWYRVKTIDSIGMSLVQSRNENRILLLLFEHITLTKKFIRFQDKLTAQKKRNSQSVE